MKLLSLTAKNYRTLQDLNLTFSRHYCTISGCNNAGKSSVIRLLTSLLHRPSPYLWENHPQALDFKEDRTQWVKPPEPIEIAYGLELAKADDPALISFIEKFSDQEFATEHVSVTIRYHLAEKGVVQVAAEINDRAADTRTSKEIDAKIRDSDALFLYNSTMRQDHYFYGPGRPRTFYDFVMSAEERKALDDAGKTIDRRFRRLARQHREGLNEILGRLSEKYDVEFSQPEGGSTRHMPLGITLRDRRVEVPLGEWGSGTQNRTRILMSVLQASRIKKTVSVADRITPIIVVEEPESFLHPSAQAEFGSVLRALARDLGIQTIVTTHSPYLLDREDPGANILLRRDRGNRKAGQTCVVATAGNNWMAPFAEHLGIPPNEFESWRHLFSSYTSRVLLVEGEIDKDYFEYMRKMSDVRMRLVDGIEVVPYGGKDTLKNTLLVKFVLGKFDHVFVTYDLDAADEVKGALGRLGLREGTEFLGLGVAAAGKSAIEGLLPERVLSVVNGRETELVMALQSGKGMERNNARSALKKKYLEEFKRMQDFSEGELEGLRRVVTAINRRLGVETIVEKRGPSIVPSAGNRAFRFLAAPATEA